VRVGAPDPNPNVLAWNSPNEILPVPHASKRLVRRRAASARSPALDRDVQRFKSYTAKGLVSALEAAHARRLLEMLRLLKAPHKVESTSIPDGWVRKALDLRRWPPPVRGDR